MLLASLNDWARTGSFPQPKSVAKAGKEDCIHLKDAVNMPTLASKLLRQCLDVSGEVKLVSGMGAATLSGPQQWISKTYEEFWKLGGITM